MKRSSKRIIDRAFRMLEKAHGNLNLLPAPARTIIQVSTAQAIIDNGGLQYFFETNFENLTPYHEFCDAYRAIGATDAASLLGEAVAMFPFPDSHLHAEQRCQRLEELWKENDRFAAIDSRLCGDETAWKLLDIYAIQHDKLIQG